MNTINELVSKINEDIEQTEEHKERITKEREKYKNSYQDTKNDIETLKNIIHSMNIKKIITGWLSFLIISIIYIILVFSTDILNDNMSKVLALILAIDLIAKITEIISKKMKKNIAKQYDFIDYYSLYQQYNILKNNNKFNNKKIGELEVLIINDEEEINRLNKILIDINEIASKKPNNQNNKKNKGKNHYKQDYLSLL